MYLCKMLFAFTVSLMLFQISLDAQDMKSVLKPESRLGLVSDWSIRNKGFSKYIEIYILACAGRRDVKVFHIDRHREALSCMGKRLKKTMFWVKPTDVVLINSGMCDVTSKTMSEKSKKACMTALNEIITQLKVCGLKNIVIAWPAYAADPNLRKNAEVYNKNLKILRDIARDVTKKKRITYSDIFTTLQKVLEKTGNKKDLRLNHGVKGWYPDFNSKGDLVLAYTVLKTLGFDGHIGTIDVNMTGKTTATCGHKIINANPGRIEIESSRYPFCFERANRKLLPFLPFNNELNRFMLKVKNLKTPKARVTWGHESHEFPKEQLENGINLTAEFTKTPFDNAFANLKKKILEKEAFEVTPGKFCKTMTQGQLMKRMKGNKNVSTSLETINKGIQKRWHELYQNVYNAYQPVRHKISIKPVPYDILNE